MSSGTSIPVVLSRLLELIDDRVGASAKVLDQTPIQVVDMIANAGRPSVIYLGSAIDVTYSIEIMNQFELRMNERFTIPVFCEVSAQAANVSLDDARRSCAELAYAVLTTIARRPDLGLEDDDEHQFFEVLPVSASYIHGVVGDSAVAVGVRHEITLQCNNRLILLK